jgi:hypothetical protein
MRVFKRYEPEFQVYESALQQVAFVCMLDV